MTRNPIIRAFLGDDEIHVDLFAGGGGASTGAAIATGRSPDVAINHSAEAIAMHAANHPTTKHYTESVYAVDPRRAAAGRKVALLWLSPDCTHHSKAKGGKPKNGKIRGLAWSAIPWAKHCQPRVIILENVAEWLDWGPLHRHHAEDCAPVDDECSDESCKFNTPIASRKGETFRAFVRKLKQHGYPNIEWRKLRACDYGAPTSRTRLFLVARRHGAIVWPTPSHGPLAKPYRTAAECIDWSIPCPSIFERARPLADATLARIARGIRKYVLESASPFVVQLTHGTRDHSISDPLPTITGQCRGDLALVSPLIVKAKAHGGGGNDAMRSDEPLRTITASKRGEFALAVPYLVHRSNGERIGQAPRIYDINTPLGTIVAQGQKHAICAAYLMKNYSERATGGWNGGQSLERPFSTVTVRDHHALVSAFLVRYNGQSGPQSLDEPLSTVDTTDRFGLVTVTIDGEEYIVVDIGMRMLEARELYRAQGFADSYEIAPQWNGKPLTKTAQIRMCGNSVPPPFATALVRAQFPEAA